MPGGSCLEAIPRFLTASPRTAIVVLTMHDDPESAGAALRAGALAARGRHSLPNIRLASKRRRVRD